jgi:hypothetical protein
MSSAPRWDNGAASETAEMQAYRETVSIAHTPEKLHLRQVINNTDVCAGEENFSE